MNLMFAANWLILYESAFAAGMTAQSTCSWPLLHLNGNFSTGLELELKHQMLYSLRFLTSNGVFVTADRFLVTLTKEFNSWAIKVKGRVVIKHKFNKRATSLKAKVFLYFHF